MASKSRSKIDHDFGMLFCKILGRDVASACHRRACDGRPSAADPPRAAAISRWCRFGCFFGCLLEAFVSPGSVSGSPWGVIWGPWAHFWGSSEVLLAAEACFGVSLGVPGDSWDVLGRLGGDFRDFPGNSGRPFGSILGIFLVFV